MAIDETYIGALILIILVGIVLIKKSLVNRNFGKGSTDIGSKEFVDSISSAALILFTPKSKYENTIHSIVDYSLKKNRAVLLVSSAPRTEGFTKKFNNEFNKGNLIVVKISSSQKTDRFYFKNEDAKKGNLKGKVAEISVDWLEYLSEIIEGLGGGSVLVFEPLTDLILMKGFDKAFKFMKKTIDLTAEQDVQVISFINDEAHEDNVKAGFEGLFTNIVKITNGKIKILK